MHALGTFRSLGIGSCRRRRGPRSIRTRTERCGGCAIERFEERRLLATFAAGDWGWVGLLGGGQRGSSETNYARHATALDSAGNIYVVGNFSGTADFDPGDASTMLASAGDQDAFLAKYSVDGSLVWVNRFGSAGLDAALSVAVAPDDTVVIGGLFNDTVDFDPGPATAALKSAGYIDGFIAKYDAAGRHIWSGRVGSATGRTALGNFDAREAVQGLAIDGAGTIYATGAINGAASLEFRGGTTPQLKSEGLQNTFVLSLNAAGAVNWGGTFASGFVNFGSSIAIDARAGRIVVGGCAATSKSVAGSEMVDFDPGPGTANRASVGLGDSYLAVLGTDGTFRWAERFGSTDDDATDAVAVDAEGTIYAIGCYTKSPFDADPGRDTRMLSVRGDWDIWIAAYSSQGGLRWAQGIGGTSVDRAAAITVDGRGVVTAVGMFSGVVDFDAGDGGAHLTSKGNTDGFVLRVAGADGTFKGVTQIGGSRDDDASGVAVGGAGEVVVVGKVQGEVDFDPGSGTAVVDAGSSPRTYVARLGGGAGPGEETVSVRVSQGTVEEGNSGTRAVGFEITRTGPATGRLSVGWAVGGGGANPVDPGDFPEDVFPSGTVEFLPGETRKTVTFDLRGDTTEEEDETIVVRIADAGTTRVVTRTGEVTVLDDDFSTPYRLRPLQTGWYEGDTRTSPMTFELRRNGDLTAAAEVAWSVRGSGAAPADSTDFADEQFPSGTVRFSPGQRTQYLTLNVRGDRDVEADESFTVSIVGRTDGEPVLASAVGVILNDDIDVAANNFIGIRSLSADRAEGTSAVPTPFTFTVYREGMVTEAASVRWAVAGSGRAPATASDFSGGALPSGVVSFAAGETSKVITVNVNADSVSEADEGFVVTLSGATGARIVTSEAFGRIREDDTTVAVAVDAPEKLEGQSGSVPFVFTVTRPGDLSAPMTVRWRTLGSGGLPAGPADFVGGVLPTGTVAFAAGEATKTFTVAVAGDTIPEQDERFLVEVAGDAIRPATAAATIINDDVGLAFLPTAGRVLEGNSGTSPLTLTVCRTGPLGGATTVAWAVQASGTNPAAAADFTGGSFPSGAVSFAAGERLKTIVVPVAGDTTFEPDETFAVVLSSAVGAEITTGSVTGTIVNDEAGVSIAAVEAARREGNSGLSIHRFVVTRTNPGAEPVRVNWSVAGTGSAAADATDFAASVLPSGTIVFGAGETSRTIEVAVRGDTEIESDESFTVTLAGASGATIAVASATATIIGDDSGIAVAAAQAAVYEGNVSSTPFNFTVTRTGATVDPLTASWSVFGWGAAPANSADFSGASLPYGSITFKPGETTKTISIGVVGDADPEPDEAFLVKITAAGNAKILTGAASSTILGDDTGVSLKPVSVAKPEGQSGSTVYSFQAIRTGRTDTACSASWTVAGIGPLAADASDFTGGQLPAGTVSFAAGETTTAVSVSVAGDVVAEADEQFSVTLSAPVNAAVVAGVGRGTIRNDDTSVAVGPAVVSRAEGRSGNTLFVFGVTRTGLTTGPVTVAWNVSGLGLSPATADDFTGGTLPSGTVTLQPGQTAARLVVLVAGDTVAEADEGFAVTLSDAGDASIVRAVAEGSIINDDEPPAALSATALAFAALAAEKPVARARIFV